jgi:hypothetical protein
MPVHLYDVGAQLMVAWSGHAASPDTVPTHRLLACGLVQHTHPYVGHVLTYRAAELRPARLVVAAAGVIRDLAKCEAGRAALL